MLVVATVLAVTGWVAGVGTRVVSDIRELVPSDLPALQSVDRLQAATGVSQELDVLVTGDVTTPTAIKQNTLLTVTLFGTVKSVTANDIYFVDPDFAVM